MQLNLMNLLYFQSTKALYGQIDHSDALYFRFGDPFIQLPLSHCFLFEVMGFTSL